MAIALGRRSVVGEIGGELRSGANGPATSGTGASADDAGKYEVLGPIGHGGVGEVLLVQDRDLRRDVAMKVLRSEFADQPAMKRKFVAEAQATSQLEHPGIPPVHDIGTAPDGRVYFTMKVVRGRTLTEVLKDLFLGRKETRAEFTVHKLMTVMERICEAVHFAHEKGVIHRDLKPDNVMLGEFGEVHVMDWGIAKVAATTGPGDESGDAIRTVDTDDGSLTQVGTVKGTIPYMSPEQAHGRPLDRRSDVYSLGTILYEMLALMPAYDGPGPALLFKVRDNEHPPVETRNPRRPVHESLARLCRHAMARDPADRPSTAHDLAAELRTFLDGRAEKERRHGEAEALTIQGREAMDRYARTRDSIRAADAEVQEEAAKVRPWQSLDTKTDLLMARERSAALRDEAAAAFADAANLFGAALVAEPDHAGARAFGADLWRTRLDDAESRGLRDDATISLRMLRRSGDGRLDAYITGDGTIDLTSEPAGAEVLLHRFEDRHGVLRLGEPQALGFTPLRYSPVRMGSYLCVLRLAGFRDVRYPVRVARNRVWSGCVRMLTDDGVGDGFVHVPGGPFICGDDHEGKSLPDFAIMERPVTFADWAVFLEAVEKENGLEAAQRLCPRTPLDGPYMARLSGGIWSALPNNVEGEARVRCLREHGPSFEGLLPVAGISWFDAADYCSWRARTTGREWRLPTADEREKAARGVDGRRFPWGDLEDATLGKCQDSREERSQPEPAGTFPTATSVYGMIDAAGNSWDWTDTWLDHRLAARIACGGGWNDLPSLLRCARRSHVEPSHRGTDFGLRCARGL